MNPKSLGERDIALQHQVDRVIVREDAMFDRIDAGFDGIDDTLGRGRARQPGTPAAEASSTAARISSMPSWTEVGNSPGHRRRRSP